MPDDVSALQLLLTGDPALLAIVRLSLIVSLSAVVFGALIGVPFGAAVALRAIRSLLEAIETAQNGSIVLNRSVGFGGRDCKKRQLSTEGGL
jgi:ABC-type tungstate transport system substrate-binding protein